MSYSNSIATHLHQFSRQLQLGKIVYRFYYQPKGFLIRCIHKGVLNIVIDSYARQQMERAAYQLPTVASFSIPSFDIHFLTGKKFWDQTCFCAYSMAQHTPVSLRPWIYDDGSLAEKHQTEIKRIFPNAQIITNEEITELINQHLPENKFPYLRERRINYPNIRKLTDVHVGSMGWKLVLDSDMLFFQTPEFLINWLKSPETPCHMVDVETSYGYSQELMESLAQTSIPQKLNVGICGLKSEDIDWEQLEHWCKILIEQQGTHYYQEQALIAMLMANHSCAVAPSEDYIVMPNQQQVISPQAVMHHYVSDSKSLYFRYGWKHVLHSSRFDSLATA